MVFTPKPFGLTFNVWRRRLALVESFDSFLLRRISAGLQRRSLRFGRYRKNPQLADRVYSDGNH